MPLGFVLFLRLSNDHQEIRKRVGGLRVGRRGIWEEQGTNLKSPHLYMGCFPEEKTRLSQVLTLSVLSVLPSHTAHRAAPVAAQTAESQGESHRDKEREKEKREEERQRNREGDGKRETQRHSGGTHILTSLCQSL